MKKTKLMRAALLLLVLTLITSCFVGGTFAKYVTEGDSTDSARVAKWGVGITANGATFAKEYDAKVNVGTITKSVVSADDSKVVAPGTSGSMVQMTLTGKPEVAVKVSYAPVFNVEGWTVAANSPTPFYCPLIIKVSTKLDDGSIGNTVIMGRDYDNEADFENAVNVAIATYNDVYEAGTDLSGVNAKSLSVSWEWPFENTTDPNAKYPQTDANDTALGNAGNATISLKVTTTVTQID